MLKHVLYTIFAFKFIKIWADLFSNKKENEKFQNLKERITNAQKYIKSRHEVAKSLPGRDIVYNTVRSTVQHVKEAQQDLESDKENHEPQIEDCEPTHQQVIDNNLIFKYIRDQYFSE